MTDVFKLSTNKRSKEGVKMNLIDFKRDVPLTAPTAEDDETPKEMFLVLKGAQSPEMVRLGKRIQKRADQEDDHSEMTDDEIEEQAKDDARMLVSLTVGGCVFGNGKWHEGESFTDEFAYSLFSSVPEFKNQAFKFISKAGNYTEG